MAIQNGVEPVIFIFLVYEHEILILHYIEITGTPFANP